MLFILLPGCRNDDAEAALTDSLRRGGRPVGSALSVLPSLDPGRTKSAYTGDPATVADWCLLQFDADDGLLVARYYQASGADLTDIAVVSDHPYDWYAVANVGDMTRSFTPGLSTEAQADAWLATGFDAVALAASGGLPMSWKVKGLAFSQAQLRDGARLTIDLTRLVAKYDITIDRSGLAAYVFTVTGLTFEGPSSVGPFLAANRAEDGAVSSDRATAADVAALNAGDAATFYALENRYGDLLSGNTDRWRKKPANLPAGACPSFVEVKGTARDRIDASAPLIPVTYRFYLGGDATANFDVIRNTSNTVTLLLSDAAVEAAVAELENGAGGDPIWKVEAGSYTDDRSLAFAHEDITLPADGTSLLEQVIKHPADLPFVLKMDAALIDAGMKVFTDAALTQDVTPASALDAVTLPGSVTGLYFQYPAGGAAVTGTVRIETPDGRKSDELAVRSGSRLAGLALIITNAGDVAYTAEHPLDTVFANYRNYNTVAHSLPFRIEARYSDGSSRVLKNNEYTFEEIVVAGAETGTVAAAAVNNAQAMFNLQNALTAANDSQTFKMEKTATASGTIRFADPDGRGTATLPFAIQTYRGFLSLDENGKTTSPKTENINLGMTSFIRYWYVADNGESINISRAVAGGCTMPSRYLTNNGYDAEQDAIQVTATSLEGYADVTVPERSFDKLTIFGPRCASAAWPTREFNSAATGYFKYRGFNIVDNAKCTGLTVTPSSRSAQVGGTIVSFRAIATFDNGSTADVTALADWRLRTNAAELVTSLGEGRFQTGNTAGTTSIQAEYSKNSRWYSGYATIEVTQAPVTVTQVTLQVQSGSEWTSSAISAHVGDTQTYRIEVSYSDGNKEYLTDGFTLVSSNPAIVSVGSAVSTALAVGSTTVRAIYNGTGSSNEIGITVAASSHTPVSYTYRVTSLLSSLNAVDDYTNIQGWYDTLWDDGTTSNSDVTAETVFTLDDALAAVAVLEKNGSTCRLRSNNSATSPVTGKVYGRYTANGNTYEDYVEITINGNVTPVLSVTPGSASWAPWECYAGGNTRMFTVSSNSAWTVSFVSGGDDFLVVGSTGHQDGSFTVVPREQNWTASNKTARLKVAVSGGPEVLIDLVQHKKNEDADGNPLYAKLVITGATPGVAAAPSHGLHKGFSSEIADGGRVTYQFTYSLYRNAAMTGTPVWESVNSAFVFVKSTAGAEYVRLGEIGYDAAAGMHNNAINGIVKGANSTTEDKTATITAYWGDPSIHAGTESDYAEITVNGNAVPPTYAYKLVTEADPTTLQVAGAYNPAGSVAVASLSAKLYKQTSVGGEVTVPWTLESDVTASGFTAVSGGSCVRISGATATAVAAGTATIRSAYTGQTIAEYADAVLQVEAAVPAPVITYGEFFVTVRDSEIAADGTTSVQALLRKYSDGVETADSPVEVTGDTRFTVSSGPASVSGHTVTGTNTTTSDATVTVKGTYTGTLDVSGAKEASVSLTVKGKPVLLTGIAFDRAHYELVRVEGGAVVRSQEFTVTASYDDGNVVDVTAEATYADQGSVSLAAGRLTAQEACSGKTLTATYGGKTASATYAAADLSVPVQLTSGHFEHQSDSERIFMVDGLEVTFEKVFSKEQSYEDVTAALRVTTAGLVVNDGYDAARGWMFHLSDAGSGSVTFRYEHASGITVQIVLSVACESGSYIITHTWN